MVYIKTLKPLVSELEKIFPSSKFTMITNGSLLNAEINDWIMENDIGGSISHDGPGQKHRGPDPFGDLTSADAILNLYRMKKAANNPLTIGAMIHAQNPDRRRNRPFAKIYKGAEPASSLRAFRRFRRSPLAVRRARL